MKSIFQCIMPYFIEQLQKRSRTIYFRSTFVTLERKSFFIWNLGLTVATENVFPTLKTDWYFTIHSRVIKEMFDNYGAVCIIMSLTYK